MTSRRRYTDKVISQTFYWIWVPIIQGRLDVYRDYWNNHKSTGHKDKVNPYRSSPKNMLINSESVRATGHDCSIRVNPETVECLRQAYGGEEERKKAYRFISREFEALADGVYLDLGRPTITLELGWAIFTLMVEKIEGLE
jgi:hypothetical protein